MKTFVGVRRDILFHSGVLVCVFEKKETRFYRVGFYSVSSFLQSPGKETGENTRSIKVLNGS